MRHRKPANKDLPEGMYRNGPYYRMRIGGRWKSLGRDYAKARYRFDMAHRKRTYSGSFGALLKEYERDYLSELQLAESTLAIRRQLVTRYVNTNGKARLEDINDRGALKELWAPLSPHARKTHRAFMVVFLDWCVSEGYAEENEAKKTTRPVTPRRKRQRWDIEGIHALRAEVAPWLRCAIDLAITSCQRRADLVAMPIRTPGDRLTLRQSKTGTRVEIPLDQIPAMDGLPSLREAVSACRALPEVGQTLIRCGGPVTEDRLTKSITRARKRLGIYDEKHGPTLHEFRSFGLWRLHSLGWGTAVLRGISGHRTEKQLVEYLSHYEKETVLRAA